ncbi:MAG: hypothetical protein CL760_08760 [Chloroflexi bacterium]|nr:hypothetical protein [Chloroflexota bacterium]|tara:strand:- start:737 stop:1627 length:891 start_codon:yes stop_codon:yes gene_type:complete
MSDFSLPNIENIPLEIVKGTQKEFCDHIGYITVPLHSTSVFNEALHFENELFDVKLLLNSSIKFISVLPQRQKLKRDLSEVKISAADSLKYHIDQILENRFSSSNYPIKDKIKETFSGQASDKLNVFEKNKAELTSLSQQLSDYYGILSLYQNVVPELSLEEYEKKQRTYLKSPFNVKDQFYAVCFNNRCDISKNKPLVEIKKMEVEHINCNIHHADEFDAGAEHYSYKYFLKEIVKNKDIYRSFVELKVENKDGKFFGSYFDKKISLFLTKGEAEDFARKELNNCFDLIGLLTSV